MQQTGRRSTAITDILSAVLLWLSAVLAMVNGPLGSGAPGSPPQAGQSRAIGERDPAPAPVESKRTTVAMEAQAAAGPSVQDDGKAKAALAPAALRLPSPSRESIRLAAPPRGSHASAGRAYGARAPPALT